MNQISYNYVQRDGSEHAWEVSRIVPITGKAIFGYITYGRYGMYWTPAHMEIMPASFITALGRKLDRLIDTIADGAIIPNINVADL